jgi:hypothetical protein
LFYVFYMQNVSRKMLHMILLIMLFYLMNK